MSMSRVAAHQPVPPTPGTSHVQGGLSGRSPLKQEPRAVLSACSHSTELPSQHGACHHRPYYCLTTLNQLFYMGLRGISSATWARVRRVLEGLTHNYHHTSFMITTFQVTSGVSPKARFKRCVYLTADNHYTRVCR